MRIYDSALSAGAAAGLDRDRLRKLAEDGAIECTGSGGAMTAEDVERYLKGQEEDGPSKEALIRRGLADGLSNDEIGRLVQETLGEDVPWDNGYVGWTIGYQRRENTDWWQVHGPRIVVERGVKPRDLPEERLTETRAKYEEE